MNTALQVIIAFVLGLLVGAGGMYVAMSQKQVKTHRFELDIPTGRKVMNKDEADTEAKKRWGADGYAWNNYETKCFVGLFVNNWHVVKGRGETFEEAFKESDATDKVNEEWRHAFGLAIVELRKELNFSYNYEVVPAEAESVKPCLKFLLLAYKDSLENK